MEYLGEMVETGSEVGMGDESGGKEVNVSSSICRLKWEWLMFQY